MPFPLITRDAEPVRRVFPMSEGQPVGTADLLQYTTFRKDPGLAVDCHYGARAVMLDPEFTSPGSVIAVRADDGGDAQLLRPGDIAVFPKAVKRFRAWNALGQLVADLWSTGMTSGQRLRVAFLAAQAPELLVERHRVTAARPKLSLLSAADVATTDAVPAVIFASGLRALRVSVVPKDANRMLNPVPGDFTATLRPWVLAPAGTADDGTPGRLRVLAFPYTDPVDGGWGASIVSPPKPAALWLPNEEGDLAATPTQLTFDREAPAGSMGFGFSLAAVGGTDVDHVYLMVEGF